MRHRLKFSQSSYIRMRGREWRGKKQRAEEERLRSGHTEKGLRGREAWRKTPGKAESEVHQGTETGEEGSIRDREPAQEVGRDPQTPPAQRRATGRTPMWGGRGAGEPAEPPALGLFPRGQQGSG